MEQNTNPFVGVSAKPNTTPLISWEDFFNFKKYIAQLHDFLTLIENQEMEKGNLKYFKEEDLEEKKAFDKEGKPVKNEKGEQITYKDLKDSFWEVPKPPLIVPSTQIIT